MLETEIKKLTAAVTELTETLKSNGVAAAPATTPAETPEPTPAPTESAAAAPATEEAPAAEAAPAADDDVFGGADKAGKKKIITEAFIKLAQDKGREVAAQLLAEYGIAKLPELTDESKWAEFYTKTKTELEA